MIIQSGIVRLEVNGVLENVTDVNRACVLDTIIRTRTHRKARTKAIGRHTLQQNSLSGVLCFREQRLRAHWVGGASAI